MSRPQDSSSKNPPANDTFKILIATDIHLGYEERLSKKTNRYDSFTTFEEILQIGVDKQVDFMLLGGDLFHDSKPSQNVVLDCINLLKKYCLGDRPVTFSFLSNPADVLSNTSHALNFENENLSIGLPIFTIHGNHDNPSFNYTGTLDILVASGLVNYFSKFSDLNKITVTPMILEKGETLIAIYGISYIGEQRLSRLFSQNQVTFLRPNITKKCFNILVLHQNRVQHSKKNFIAENKLPNFFDLIFWGHEHECKITPERVILTNNDEDDFYHITQPGSSVATSLCEGEARLKHVGLLKIYKSQFTIEPLRLKTVRPFVYDSISLRNILQKEYCDSSVEGLVEYVDDFIEHSMFTAAEKLLTGHPQQPKLPLIRLKLFYSEDDQKFDGMKITRKYCDRVANANDIILFAKERSIVQSKTHIDGIDDDAAIALAECFKRDKADKEWSFTVQEGIQKYFDSQDYKLKILSMLGMNEALDRCVKANDDDALESIFQHQIQKTLDFFEGRKIDLTQESYEEEIVKFHQQRARKNAADEKNEYQQVLDDDDRRLALRADDMGDLDSDQETAPVQTTRGRGRGSKGSRATKTTRGATRARGTRGRGSAGKAPLDVSINNISPTKSESRTTSRDRIAQTVSQLKAAPPQKSVFDMSEYENLDFSDSE